MKSNLIEIWGFKTFRPFRIYWALEEFNLKYKSYKIGSRTGETQTNEYLDMNPKGKIPFFRHNDIGISESVAAMNYVVSNFKKPSDLTNFLNSSRSLSDEIFLIPSKFCFIILITIGS